MDRLTVTMVFVIFLLLSVPSMAQQLPGHSPGPKNIPSQPNVPGVINHSCEDKIRSMQAIIDKQHELIATMQSELDKCKEGENGKKP